MRAKLITLVIIVMISITANAQGNQQYFEISKKTIVGKWSSAGTNAGFGFIAADSSGFTSTLIFNKNDTYELKVGDGIIKGKYKIDGNNLILIPSSADEKEMKIRGSINNMLKMTYYDEDLEMGFEIYYKKDKE